MNLDLALDQGVLFLESFFFQLDFGMKWSTLSIKFCQIFLTVLFNIQTRRAHEKDKAHSATGKNGPCSFYLRNSFSFYADASAVVSPSPSAVSSPVYPSTQSSNSLYLGRPVPAGIRRPMITFSFNPFKLSTFPATAA